MSGWLNQGLFSRLSSASRAGKIEMLRKRFSLQEGATVLDLGSQVDNGQILEMRAGHGRVVAMNLMPEHLRRIGEQFPSAERCVGNALHLPFPDQTFDLVYSNAVIEHVGSFEDQKAMAREVMRVGRNWFIATPNRWFPFEFHMRLPLVSWLPAPQMKRVGKLCSYSHQERRYRSGIEQQIRLMTSAEMKQLFPSSEVVALRITAWPETLIAVGGADV